jgi:hypothetical protein
MKFLVPALILVAFFAIVIGGVFYIQMKLSNGQITVPTAPAPVIISQNATTTTGASFTPPVFHGPTGQPHIIGPSSNPPNY